MSTCWCRFEAKSTGAAYVIGCGGAWRNEYRQDFDEKFSVRERLDIALAQVQGLVPNDGVAHLQALQAVDGLPGHLRKEIAAGLSTAQALLADVQQLQALWLRGDRLAWEQALARALERWPESRLLEKWQDSPP